MRTACIYEPDLLFRDGQLVSGEALGVDDSGQVCAVSSLPARTPRLRLEGRVLLPGAVNAHSHAFQRLIRGRTEFLSPGHPQDDFWSWRERMYQAVERLTPEDVYTSARQCYLEMARAGITTVGEFHYLHHDADGKPYAEPDLLAHAIVRAARDVGLRLTLLRVGYARAGSGLPANPRQRRFYDRTPDDFHAAVSRLQSTVTKDPLVRVGLAPHSVRACPESWLLASRDAHPDLPLHMHVSEQPAENAACLAEHGVRPVALLERLGLLSSRFTAVHAIHLDASERTALGAARALVCACPSTETNLGDGVIAADDLMKAGVRICLGSDSQTELDILSEARQLEGHLRLIRGRRAVLDDGREGPDGLARVLLRAATEHGSSSLGWAPALLQPGSAADFFTLDLEHPALVGTQGLSSVMFSSAASAVREVVVQGRPILSEGRHALEEESGRAFQALAKRVFA